MSRPESATSRQESEMVNKSIRELQSGHTTGPEQRLRLLCLSRGGTGYLELGRMFRRLVRDRTRDLNFDVFLQGLRKIGLEVTDEEAKEIFDQFDTTGNGYIHLDEFLLHIRPPLNDSRMSVIEKAFKKIDKSGYGEITIDELKRAYNVNADPLYISGEDSEEKILNKFMEHFELGVTRDGKVTKEEFFNYYAAVSASIDNDCYFDLILRQAYKL